MENVNAKMDEQLKARVDDLTRSNDENCDGKLDAADLKAQLNRIEAQLELQDRQNRGIIANQRKRMILSVVLVVVILAALAFFGWLMPNREASYKSQMLVPFLRLILAIVFGVQAIGLTVVKKALLEKQEQ